MAAGIGRGFTLDDHQHQLERQMGCMTGFLQLFDRHQILTGRRLYSTRRLPSSPTAGSTSPTESYSMSEGNELWPSSPESAAMVEQPGRPSLPLPLPVFDFKDGAKTNWKLREAPRLSLDSRAVVDGKGNIRTAVTAPLSETAETDKQRRSPSVVARLMGLEALPQNGNTAEPNRSELRRSASESRLQRDPSYYQFIESNAYEKPAEDMLRANMNQFRLVDAKKTEIPRGASTMLPPLQRKAFFAEDFFPDPKRSGPLYGEIEKRLRMKGIDEPAKDLETLKQILEALQLKGLLHSNLIGRSRRNDLIYDQRYQDDAPIVLMRPAVTSRPPRPPFVETTPPAHRSGAARRASQATERSPANRDRTIDRNSSGGGNVRRRMAPRSPESPSSSVRRKPWNAGETPKSPQPQRRMSAGNSSPKASPRWGSPVTPPTAKSPRYRRPNRQTTPKEAVFSPADDESSSTISESSISSSFQHIERSRVDEYKAGRSLLERCDKLLHSIAAFTGEEQVSTVDQQPSPVSVLESSSFLALDNPSPLPKRSIDFNKEQAVEWEDELLSASNDSEAEDEDYMYVAEILRLSRVHREASTGLYAALEKRHYASGTSKSARLHRRLIFDTVIEILDENLNVSSWESFAHAISISSQVGGFVPQLGQVWRELKRIREQVVAEDLNGVTCGVIKKDMAVDNVNGWTRPTTEMSEAVLNIERQIFKDLVAETIQNLSDVSAKSIRPAFSRRKLEF